MTQAQHPPSASTPKLFRLGAVGVDSSHLPEFTRRIAERHEQGLTPCRVTSFWTDGQHHMPVDEVNQWVANAQGLGARPFDDLSKMLDHVDGVLVLSVSGHDHLKHAAPSLRRGMPTYIDKPLACDPAEARQVRDLAVKFNAPCYSASSLRFANEIKAVHTANLGNLAAIDAYGPGELHDLMPGVLFYGVHTIEMVDALWGPGVAAVSARHTDERDFVHLRYHDGRDATLRLERTGSYDFGATVHGKDGLHSFKVDFATVYDRLIEGMTRFFDEGVAPTKLDHILENIAVMDAANRSMNQDGKWITLNTN